MRRQHLKVVSSSMDVKSKTLKLNLNIGDFIMAETSFAEQQSKQKIAWCKDIWYEAKKQSELPKFLGKGAKAVFTYVTELTQTKQGAKAIFQLLAPLMKDGVAGDNQLVGNEEEMTAHDQEITLDRLSHAVKNVGRMDDQRGNIQFAKVANPQLSEWLADRVDQLAFLTLLGISYDYNLDGSKRNDPTFQQLAFAKDVKAPSENRYRVWSGGKLVKAGNNVLTATDTPNHKMLTDMITMAKRHNIKPLIVSGKKHYIIFMDATAIGELKKDPDFMKSIINASERGKNNPWFTGAIVTHDGAVIHETERVFNTLHAPAGEKWGADGKVNGVRIGLAGCQAVAFARIGDGTWDTEKFNYGNQIGVAHGRIIGFLKPTFPSSYSGTVEDFGVLTVDCAILGDD
ncbi:phage capsid family protein [Entomomonas asaccharolytica]